MPEHDVTTRDGRTLRVLEEGPASGYPVLVHNGTPNSRLLYATDVANAERFGIRLLCYDRPGYGGSTRQEGRRIADCAADVRDIAAALGIERLGVWGISGGGPHAIACAALLADLVPAVGVLAAPAPWPSPGLDYFDGMGELNTEDMKLQLEDPAAAREKCERDRVEMLGLDLPELMVSLETLLAPVDAAELSGALGQYLIDSIHAGLEVGSDGWWDDNVALLEPWGFELAEIRTPVLLLHGRADRFVPFAHGEWLAGQIPGVEAILSDTDGHLTLTARHLDEVHAWLVARMEA
jgi:pimeloyl-ACP methyl ester carboxylesterase